MKFARYLAEEIHATPSQFSHSGSSSDASDDEDDDDEAGGWLARSSPFDLRQPTLARSPQEASSTGFDVSFLKL